MADIGINSAAIFMVDIGRARSLTLPPSERCVFETMSVATVNDMIHMTESPWLTESLIQTACLDSAIRSKRFEHYRAVQCIH